MSGGKKPVPNGDKEQAPPQFRVQFRWYALALIGLLIPALAAHFGYLPQIVLVGLVPILFFAFPAWLLSLVFAIVGRLRGKM
jgi:hypothetical protein